MPSDFWVEMVVIPLSAFFGSFVLDLELFCQNWVNFGPALYPTADSEFHQGQVLLDRLFCTYGSQLLEALMTFADFYYIFITGKKSIKAGANPNQNQSRFTAGNAVLQPIGCPPWNISLTKAFVSRNGILTHSSNWILYHANNKNVDNLTKAKQGQLSCSHREKLQQHSGDY